MYGGQNSRFFNAGRARGASAEEEAEALAAPRGSAAAERLSDTGEATRPVCPGGWME